MFICSSTDGHLDGLHLSVTGTNAVYLYTQVVQVPASTSWIHSEKESCLVTWYF